MRFHMTHSPRSSIGCVQHDFRADGTFKTNHAPFFCQDYHCLQRNWNKLPLKPMVRLVQTVHLYRTDSTLSPNGPKRDSTRPTHLGVPSVAFKTISKPMVRLAQTAHLSCIKISTVSKQTQTSFKLRMVTWEYHLVHPKWFLSLWYVWRNPCTYIALTLTLSLNRPKRDSIWPTHLRFPSGVSKMISRPMVHST
jgi:hypothetical protein